MICTVLLVLSGALAMQTMRLRNRQETYQERIEALEGRIDKEEARGAQLEEERVYVQTKQYIEEAAREKLGLVNEDELLIKPNE